MKIPEAIQVRYKLLSRFARYQDENVYEGELVDIDRQQAVITGTLPDSSWIEALEQGKVLIGLNVLLPADSVPIKILTVAEKVVQNHDGQSGQTDIHFVLNFREISENHHRRIIRFIVGLYLRKPGGPQP